ncbi:MAG: hypothetical protein WB643_09465 [Candidatus Bathyarchaeia archaeon]
MAPSKYGILLTRIWYYFRIGYGTYLTFLLGLVSTATVVYYLLVKNVPQLHDIFSSFTRFIVIAALVGVPLSTIIGWLHIKGTSAMASEQDIMAEANPYAYKLQPGYLREAFAPLYLEMIRLLKKIADRENLITSEERNQIENLENMMKTLIQGGYVGTPRRRPLTQQ